MPRLTFPKVAVQQHPQATGAGVALTAGWVALEPDLADRQIAEEILAIQSKINKHSPATGEWSWINQNKRLGYLKVLQEEDALSLAKTLTNMFRNESIYGLISSDFLILKSAEGRLNLENNILLDLDAWREFTEQDDYDLKTLDMPRVGNPYGLMLQEILIAADNPRHDYFAWKLQQLAIDARKERPRILDIGGGYGGLGLQIHRRMQNVCYVDCDLPESLYLAYYFLRKALNKKIIWAVDEETSKLTDADIILVPATNLDLISGSVDIIFNANSFSEMGRKTIDEYISLLHRLRPMYFLHQNSNFLLFPKSQRHVEILASAFPISYSLYQEVYRAMAPWQGGSGRYREFLYKIKF